MVAAWSADVDTGDGSGARAKVHRAGPAWASSSSVGPRSAEGRCRPVPAPRPCLEIKRANPAILNVLTEREREALE
jgi:hypothetical protein